MRNFQWVLFQGYLFGKNSNGTVMAVTLEASDHVILSVITKGVVVLSPRGAGGVSPRGTPPLLG